MASWWKQTLDTANTLTGMAWGGIQLLTRQTLPQKRGRVSLPGLHEAVNIITDRYGVPHIYAQNEDDLYFAQGYVHAQERLWQMELNRRIGSGRLAEIFGAIALEADRFSRRLGMHRAAAQNEAQLSPHNKRILETYSRGVNTFIELHANKLPVEFTLLRYKPQPWQPVDSIQWGKMMGWNLAGNWETEVVRAHLIARLGIERASQLEAGYDPRQPLIIPPGVEYQGINTGMLEQYERLKELSGFGLMGASNNWVVDGTKSATGSPILCNDPHLGQATPSIWFECHLASGDLDVVGASFPGTPGIVIGHNRSIAWGVTNAISDVADLYVEKFHPENPHQYEYQGQWEDAKVIREEIRIKDQEIPVIEEVLVTRHGPLLTSIPNPNGNNSQSAELPLTLRWTGLEQGDILTAINKLNRASDWEGFRDAMRSWDVPPQNFVYADVDGNIGYIMAGAIPIRAQGQSLVPSPGWTGEYEWTGLIPFDELPQIFNPEQHFIVTANNRVVDDNYPYYITNEWLGGYRAQRIRDLLQEKETLTPEDMANIQRDQYALPALEIVPHLLHVQPINPVERAAQEILQTWDYVLAPNSIGATIYIASLTRLERIVFEALLGDDETLLHSYLGVGSTILASQNGYAGRIRPLLIRLLEVRDESWFAHSAIPNGPTSWDGAVAAAFHGAIEHLREKLGDNILEWQYGATHKISFRHALGVIKPLEGFFNRGPYPFGGDIDTVCMGATSADKPEDVITVPSFRQIVNMAHLASSLSGHAPGQSGHPTSKHYDDFIQMWLKVQHHPMLFEREDIEEHAADTLLLLPK